MQAGHEGTVKLRFLVDENVRVKDSKVMASSGFTALDEAALKKGKAVQQWTKVRYVWRLRQA